eukprot:702508-Rhodomonas_salina.6
MPVPDAISLRACYAMSGTDIPHAASCYAMPSTDIAHSTSSLHACYATPGADLGAGLYQEHAGQFRV